MTSVLPSHFRTVTDGEPFEITFDSFGYAHAPLTFKPDRMIFTGDHPEWFEIISTTFDGRELFDVPISCVPLAMGLGLYVTKIGDAAVRDSIVVTARKVGGIGEATRFDVVCRSSSSRGRSSSTPATSVAAATAPAFALG